jgi:hypothetical protein
LFESSIDEFSLSSAFIILPFKTFEKLQLRANLGVKL